MPAEQIEILITEFYEKLDSDERGKMTEHSCFVKTLNRIIELHNEHPEHRKMLKNRLAEYIAHYYKFKSLTLHL